MRVWINAMAADMALEIAREYSVRFLHAPERKPGRNNGVVFIKPTRTGRLTFYAWHTRTGQVSVKEVFDHGAG